MPVNLRDFDNVARSSGLSGARRVVVKDDKLATKGFWQQIRLSFMHKSDRIALNKGTMTAFGSAIKQQYGGEVYESVKNSDKWNEKITNGKKLLSRDVHDFIQLCKLAEANLLPKEDSASNAEKSSTHTSSDASKLAEDTINSDQVNIASTLTVYESFQMDEVNTENFSLKDSESISQSKEEDNSVKMSEVNTENVSQKGSESISQRNEDENKTSRKLEDSSSDYQDASDNISDDDDEYFGFESGELDSNTDNVAQNKSKTDPLSSDENQTQSVPDEDLLKSNDILRKSEDDKKMTEKPQLRRTDLDFGDDQTNDPDKVVEFVNKVYGAKEYERILATTTRNQARSSQKLESELTPQEAVSTYYCAFPQDARNTDKIVETSASENYRFYPDKCICQERMNDALSKKLGKQDDEIYPMMRQANKGLDKLPVYRGTLHFSIKSARIAPFSIGDSSEFKKFDNLIANGAPNNYTIQHNLKDLMIYNIKGDACRDVSLLTGEGNEVLIKPDAVFTCTNIKKSPNSLGNEYYFDVI